MAISENGGKVAIVKMKCCQRSSSCANCGAMRRSESVEEVQFSWINSAQQQQRSEEKRRASRNRHDRGEKKKKGRKCNNFSGNLQQVHVVKRCKKRRMMVGNLKMFWASANRIFHSIPSLFIFSHFSWCPTRCVIFNSNALPDEKGRSEERNMKVTLERMQHHRQQPAAVFARYGKIFFCLRCWIDSVGECFFCVCNMIKTKMMNWASR